MTRASLARLSVLLVLAAYGGLLIARSYRSVSGADATGYANLAKSIVGGPITQPISGLDELGLPDQFGPAFCPLAYEVGNRPRFMSPIYPVGLPLHMAAAALVAGWKRGPYLISPLAAVLSLVLIYLVGRELGLERGFSVAAAAMLAANPTFFLCALQPMSDGLATCWSLGAILAALKSRRRAAFGLVCGLAIGIAILVRPTSVLLVPAILIAILPARTRVRAVLYVMLGSLAPLTALLVYNARVFGAPWLSGYGQLHLENLMTLSGSSARLKYYLGWLIRLMSPIPFLAWLVVPFDRALSRWDRALLLSWFGAFLVFYACYGFYHEWWYSRFLLPGLPAVMLGTAFLGRRLEGLFRRPIVGRLIVAVVLLVVLAFERQGIETFRLLRVGGIEMNNAFACMWADHVAPPRAIIVSMEMSGGVKYYTNRPIVRYERLAIDQWRLLQSQSAEKQYSFFALLKETEVSEAQRRLPGRWISLGTQRDISLWQIF